MLLLIELSEQSLELLDESVDVASSPLCPLPPPEDARTNQHTQQSNEYHEDEYLHVLCSFLMLFYRYTSSSLS
jgi:hypothetical protein